MSTIGLYHDERWSTFNNQNCPVWIFRQPVRNHITSSATWNKLAMWEKKLWKLTANNYKIKTGLRQIIYTLVHSSQRGGCHQKDAYRGSVEHIEQRWTIIIAKLRHFIRDHIQLGTKSEETTLGYCRAIRTTVNLVLWPLSKQCSGNGRKWGGRNAEDFWCLIMNPNNHISTPKPGQLLNG